MLDLVKRLKRLCRSSGGAVTVEFVVLTASVVLLAAAVAPLGESLATVTDGIVAALDGIEVSPEADASGSSGDGDDD